jgi:hypothetical protein
MVEIPNAENIENYYRQLNKDPQEWNTDTEAGKLLVAATLDLLTLYHATRFGDDPWTTTDPISYTVTIPKGTFTVKFQRKHEDMSVSRNGEFVFERNFRGLTGTIGVKCTLSETGHDVKMLTASFEHYLKPIPLNEYDMFDCIHALTLQLLPRVQAQNPEPNKV